MNEILNETMWLLGREIQIEVVDLPASLCLVGSSADLKGQKSRAKPDWLPSVEESVDVQVDFASAVTPILGKTPRAGYRILNPNEFLRLHGGKSISPDTEIRCFVITNPDIAELVEVYLRAIELAYQGGSIETYLEFLQLCYMTVQMNVGIQLEVAQNFRSFFFSNADPIPNAFGELLEDLGFPKRRIDTIPRHFKTLGLKMAAYEMSDEARTTYYTTADDECALKKAHKLLDIYDLAKVNIRYNQIKPEGYEQLLPTLITALLENPNLDYHHIANKVDALLEQEQSDADALCRFRTYCADGLGIDLENSDQLARGRFLANFIDPDWQESHYKDPKQEAIASDTPTGSDETELSPEESSETTSEETEVPTTTSAGEPECVLSKAYLLAINSSEYRQLLTLPGAALLRQRDDTLNNMISVIVHQAPPDGITSVLSGLVQLLNNQDSSSVKWSEIKAYLESQKVYVDGETLEIAKRFVSLQADTGAEHE